ncbi:MAG TPA: NACHT domain-containing protein [Pyrinomonadaceae bacterium]|jgi:hypothetical protein
MSIDWNNLKTLDGSQHTAFEELCCQLARHENILNKDSFFRIEAPDAGVECYWKLSNGKEIGWQAKFFLSSPNNSQWAQIDESVKTALEKHPDLSSYIICLPINRQDPRINAQKWFMDKWNERVKKWEHWAKALGRNVTFDYWGESEILDRLSSPELQGKYNYWFNKNVSEIITGEGELDKEIIKNYLRKIIEKSCELPKYLSDSKSNLGKKDLFTHIRQMVEVCSTKQLEEVRKIHFSQNASEKMGTSEFVKQVEKIEWNEKNIENFERLIILGKPGIGKSWLLRYEAKRIAEKSLAQLEVPESELEDIILPVWISLGDWAKHGTQFNKPIDSLVDLVIERFTEIRSDDRKTFNLFEVWLKRKIRSEKSIILLDALDEVPRNIDFTDKLKVFSENEAKTAKIYLTCRETEYRGSPIVRCNKDIKEISLLEFEDDQIKQFYKSWFGNNTKKVIQFESILTENSSLKDLARTPLLLSLLCALLDNYEKADDFPKSRCRIYEQCINKLFLKEWKDKKTESTWSISKFKEMMAWISFQIFSEIGEQFNAKELEELIESWHKRKKYSYSPENCKSIIQQLKEYGLIIFVSRNEQIPEESEYIFLHRTFLEFFAACGLANLNKTIDGKTWREFVFQRQILYDQKWKEVLQLLGGVLNVNDVQGYIKELINLNGKYLEKDHFIRPFTLALNVGFEAKEDLPIDFKNNLLKIFLFHYFYQPYSKVAHRLEKEIRFWGKELLPVIVARFKQEGSVLYASGEQSGTAFLYKEINAISESETILELLKNKEADVRRSALRAFVKLNEHHLNEELLLLLLQMVAEDEDRLVQQEGMIHFWHHLGRCLEKTSSQELMRLIRKSINKTIDSPKGILIKFLVESCKEVNSKTSKVKITPDEVIKIILNRVNKSERYDYHFPGIVLDKLEELTSPKRITENLLQHLERKAIKDPTGAGVKIHILTNFPGDKRLLNDEIFIKKIINWINCDNPNLQIAALYGINILKLEDVSNTFLDRLLELVRGNDTKVNSQSLSAVKELSKKLDLEIIEKIIIPLLEDEKIVNQLNALNLIANFEKKINKKSVFEKIVTFLNSDNRQILEKTLIAIANVDASLVDKFVFDKILDLQNDEYSEIRANALFASTKIKDGNLSTDTVEKIFDLLRESNPTIKEIGRNILYHLNEVNIEALGLKKIRKLLNEDTLFESNSIKQILIKAICNAKPYEGIKLLKEIIESPKDEHDFSNYDKYSAEKLLFDVVSKERIPVRIKNTVDNIKDENFISKYKRLFYWRQIRWLIFESFKKLKVPTSN